MIVRKNLIRGIAALVVAIVAFIALSSTTAKTKLVSVVTMTKPVGAGQVISSHDLGTMMVKAPAPAGMLTSTNRVAGEIAQVDLSAGQTLSSGEVAATFGGVPKGDVKVIVPVSAGQSGLAHAGNWVDVLGVAKTTKGSTTTANVVPLALGARVLGVYSQSGGPVVTSGPNPAAPGLVSLAVTPSEAQALVPYLSQSSDYWLVMDPQGVYDQAPAS